MAFTKLEPTGVNTSAIFTFSEANITGNITVNGHSNLGAVGNINITGGTSGQVLSTDGTGNLSWVDQTGGGGSSYANSNVAAYLLTNTGNIAAGYFIGNGSTLTHITGGNIDGQVGNALVASTVYTNAQPNITSVGTLNGLTVSGNIIPSANVTYDLGNTDHRFKDLYLSGTTIFLGGQTISSDVNGITMSGNIAGSGSELTDLNASNIASGTIPSSILGNSSVYVGTTSITLNRTSGSQTLTGVNIDGSASTAGTVTTNAQPNITSVGTLSSLSVTSNINSGNILTDHLLYANGVAWSFGSTYSNSNVASYLPTYTGNIAAGNIIANGYFLTATNGSNVLGQVANALVAGTVYTAAQPNITSVGTLSSVSVTANITGGNITSSGSLSAVDLTTSGNAVIAGNLTVGGTTTYVNVTTLAVKDPIIEQGGGTNGAALSSNDGKDRGSLLHYYTTEVVDAFMGWDNSNGEFAFGSNVSMSSEVATFNTFGNVRAGYYLGNGSQLTGVAALTSTTAATVTTNAQPNITSVGSLSGLTVSNSSGIVNFVTTANVSLGAVGNVHISGGTSGQYLQTDGAGGLSWSTVSSGSTSNISNGTSNVNIASSGGNVTTSVGGNANIIVVTSTGANVNGYLTVTGAVSTGGGSGGSLLGANLISANYFAGNGSSLSDIVGSNVTGQVGNALIAGTVYTAAQPNITSVGTLSSVNVTGNVSSGGNIIGNGQYLTSITGGNVTGQVANALVASTVYTNAQPNITSVGTLTTVSVSGNVSSSGNIIGNGQYLTSITGGNVSGQVSNSLIAGTVYTAAQPNITSVGTLTTVSVSGNVSSGGNIIGNGQYLTSITGGNVTGQVANALVASTVYTNAQPNITSVGTLASLTVTGLTVATAGGVKVGNIIDPSGTNTIQLSSGSISVTGNISAGAGGTGNVTATYFIGNGSQLTGISAGSTYSNANVASYLPTYTGNIAAGNGTISGTFTINGALSAGGGTGGSISGANVITANYFTGTLTTGAQPNITSVGTLASVTHSANSNITLSGSLSQITGANLVSASYLTGTLTTAAQPNITSLGTLTSLSATGTSVFGLSSDTTTYVSTSTSGTVTCDTSTTGPVWYYTTIAGATTLNFTNLPTTDGRTTVVAAMFASTTVVPSVQIAGSAQTIKWVSGSAPTGNASGINIYTFSCVRVNSAWTAILGSYSYYA